MILKNIRLGQPLTNLTIKEFSQGLKNKEFKAKEVVGDFLSNIKTKDKDVKAYLEVWEEEALERAEDVDKQIEGGGEISSLAGVPLAIKDNMLFKGHESTGGSKILEGHVAEYDATVIEKIREGAGVILGRTNMDEFAFGSSTEQSAWQVTHNPHDLELVPGGTSGGSAAAVAGRMAMAALGSDTGGSIRQPASFCGVVGLRPTYGVVSRFGLMAAASSFDQIGPITKTVEEAEILFDFIKGGDDFEMTVKEDSFEGKGDYLKLGIIKELWDEEKETFLGLDERTREMMSLSKKRLEDLGFKFEMVSLEHVNSTLATYYISIFAEESSNLARFDGLRYGKSQGGKSLSEVYVKNRSLGFGREAKRRVILGTFVLSSGFYEAYYGKAQKVRRQIRREVETALHRVDSLWLPTAPTVAFKIGEKLDDPLAMYYGDIFTVIASLTGSPALTIPVEKDLTGLPVGFQLIGRRFEEKTLFHIGKMYERI